MLVVAAAVSAQQTPLGGTAVPQPVYPLPSTATFVVDVGPLELHVPEFHANVTSTQFFPASGTQTGTWVLAYLVSPSGPITAQGTYTGPTMTAPCGPPDAADDEIQAWPPLGPSGHV
jgi:hypothetical protein